MDCEDMHQPTGNFENYFTDINIRGTYSINTRYLGQLTVGSYQGEHAEADY